MAGDWGMIIISYAHTPSTDWGASKTSQLDIIIVESYMAVELPVANCFHQERFRFFAEEKQIQPEFPGSTVQHLGLSGGKTSSISYGGFRK